MVHRVSTIRYSGRVATTIMSGGLLREARQRAGLTQAQLAEQAGTTQSVISAYESGHRQPALTTLAALVEAAGLELDVRIRRQRRGLDRLSGPRGRQVLRHRRQLVDTAAAHGVTNLSVFGSVARGEDRPDSDVDLLATLPPGMGLIGLGRLREELETLLDATVDLVPAEDLKPEVAQRVAEDVVAL
jgi:predicted nucleotidyltransferase/DNA-binding XRE family transcriptional regulator